MKRTAAAVTSLLLAACDTMTVTSSQPIKAPARPHEWGSFSLQLEQGMTDQQAIATIGYSPDSASVTTCGPRNQPTELWECRLLKYGDLAAGHTLTIYEQKIGGAWYVNSWTVF